MSYNREVQCNKALFSILDKNDTRFRYLHTTLDFLSSALQRQGLGALIIISVQVNDPIFTRRYSPSLDYY